MDPVTRRWTIASALLACLSAATLVAQTQLGGLLPGPLPLFPRSNWWNLDVSAAPLDPNSSNYIAFVGVNRSAHPDFGGEASPGSVEIYGFPYVVVDGSTPKQAVQFQYGARATG